MDTVGTLSFITKHNKNLHSPLYKVIPAYKVIHINIILKNNMQTYTG